MEGFLGTIFSIDFVYMWIRVAAPIVFPALGAAICNKAGVVNLGLEGIMLCSALFGVVGSAYGGNVIWGMAAAMGIAILLSLVFAYTHLNLKADPVLCGTAINTFASGFTVFFLGLVTGDKGTSAALKSFSFPEINIPFILDIPVIGDILSGHNLLTYIAILMVVVIQFMMYHTPLGLRIQSVGENPNAALSVGVNVVRIRYIAILMCGVLSCLGGMYLSMGYLNIFSRNMTSGRGFIALSACTMGCGTPLGTFIAAMMFAFFDGLSNILQVMRIPTEFVQMLPYLATIAGLTVYSIRRNKANKKKRYTTKEATLSTEQVD